MPVQLVDKEWYTVTDSEESEDEESDDDEDKKALNGEGSEGTTDCKKRLKAGEKVIKLSPADQRLGFPMPVPRVNDSERQMRAKERKRAMHANPNSSHRKKIDAKRIQVAFELGPKIHDVLLGMYRQLSSLVGDVRSVLSQDLGMFDTIVNISAQCAKSQNTELISVSSDAMQRIHGLPMVQEVLIAVAKDPVGFRLENYIGNGLEFDSALEEELDNEFDGIMDDELEDDGSSTDPEEPAPVDSRGPIVVKNYIRSGEMDDTTACLLRHLKSHPADGPWTVLELRARNADMKRVRREFVEFMTVHNHAEVAGRLFDAIMSLPAPYVAGGRHNILLYPGVTGGPKVADRQRQDAQNSYYRRVCNFTRANRGHITWKTAAIPALHTPLDDARDARSTPIIADTEEIVINMVGGLSANATPGGFYRKSRPSSQANTLLTAVNDEYAFIRSDPSFHLFGMEKDPVMKANIRRNGYDEVSYLTALHSETKPCSLSSPHFRTALTLRSDIPRKRNGVVPCCTFGKDATAEEILGRVPGLGDKHAGQSLHEYRRVRRWLDPTTPEHGSLSIGELAMHFGPYYNFWTWVLKHRRCWLHVLFLSRHLIEVAMVLIICCSAVLDHLFLCNAFSDVWDYIPLEMHDDVLSGQTPRNIGDYLGEDNFEHDKKLTQREFMKNIGTLVIVYVGPDCTHPRLLLRSFDGGAVKYDFRLAYIMVELQGILGIMQNVVLYEHERLSRERTVDWKDSKSLLDYLSTLRTNATDAFARLGLQAQLDKLKVEFATVASVLSHLRSLRRRHLKPYEESMQDADVVDDKPVSSVGAADLPLNDEAFYRLLPQGRKRLAATHIMYTTVEDPYYRRKQFEYIRRRMSMMMKLGRIPELLKKIVPFGMDLFEDNTEEWFIVLRAGTNLMRSAGSRGRSLEAQEAVRRTQEQWSWRAQAKYLIPEGELYSPAMVKEIENRANMLYKILRRLLVPVKNSQTSVTGAVPTLHAPRWGICDECLLVVVAFHHKCFHICPMQPDLKEQLINESNPCFTELHRILYPHDILNNVALLNILDMDLETILAKEELLAIPVCNVIFAQPLFFSTHLPDVNIDKYAFLKDNVYIPCSLAADVELQCTYAMDILYDYISEFPELVRPKGAEEINEVWGKGWDMILKAFGENPTSLTQPKSSGTQKYYFSRCVNGSALHCKTFNGLRSLDKVNRHNAKSGASACNGDDWLAIRINKFIDLPSLYMRTIWYNQRLVVHSDTAAQFKIEWADPRDKADEAYRHSKKVAELLGIPIQEGQAVDE